MRYAKRPFFRCLTVVLLIVACVVVGCSEAPTAPLAEESLTGDPGLTALSAAKASTMTSSIRVPISAVPVPIPPIPVPCANGGAGELVVLGGTIHLVFHTTVNNDRVQVIVHANPQGVTGTGQVTGDIYRGVGATQIVDISRSGLPRVFTVANTFNIIGPGPGNNLLIHDTLHMTVNANGEPTANVTNVSLECR